MNAVVTGARGFIGRHLVNALKRYPGVAHVAEIRRDTPEQAFRASLATATIVFHLAGVNRPNDVSEFDAGNRGTTEALCAHLKDLERTPLLVYASSIQAENDTPYGASKRSAERAIEEWVRNMSGRAVIFRLKNVFGKWCRPNYNSVTATFCHNLAHNLAIQISGPDREVDLVYIDDVIAALLECCAGGPASGTQYREVARSKRITLGSLAALIRSFSASRTTLTLPAFDDEFVRRLYATYVSYLEPEQFVYSLALRTDNRGTLAEFMKSSPFGQIFVSRTKPGVTRGNHYHHTKTEKFLVVEGEAVIRFRPVGGGGLIEHRVRGADFRVVDIPPGYVHSIENVGPGDLLTLFWASEIFDPAVPDCVFEPVL